MSAIGMSHGKGFSDSAYADYSHDHLVFARQQSMRCGRMEWEEPRVKPLQVLERAARPAGLRLVIGA